MYSAYEKLIQHLDERELRYTADSEGRFVWASFRCAVATYQVIASLDEERQLFQVSGIVPVRIPEGSRPAIAETIARANFGLCVGKFEVDLDTGELRFQAAQILTDDCLEETVIDPLLQTTLSMLDRYVPAVLSVIYGNEYPKDAIGCVEGVRCRNGGQRGTAPESGD